MILFPFVQWWADYYAGAASAHIKRSGRLRTPALRSYVERLSLVSKKVKITGRNLDKNPEKAHK